MQNSVFIVDQASPSGSNQQRSAARKKPRRKPKARRKTTKPPRGSHTLADSTQPERLKGLSIRQPWAERVMLGKKKEEYRSGPTHIRGRIYIYAGLLPSHDTDGVDVSKLPRGVVIGTVELYDCRETDRGDFAWQLRNPKRLAKPIKPIERPQPVWFHPFGAP